jgi:ElaB/YqjD/DUF883 family membrane-anchored ribosome-binding protein
MSKDTTSENLRAELKSLADTLEEVLNSSTDKSKEGQQAAQQSRASIEREPYRLGETGDALAKQTREAAARADEYVRDNPWTGVGIGAAVGVVLGVLLTRR